MILITGFQPFAGDQVNPSEVVARQFANGQVGGLTVHSMLLPVDTLKVMPALVSAMEALKPKVVLLLGYANGRTCINIERFAVNTLDFSIPDNAGNHPVGLPIVPNGPDGYMTNLPIHRLQDLLRSSGVPCQISNNAGTYLCNQVFYTAMHHIRSSKLPISAGFIHLPALPDMEKALSGRIPSMSLELMVRGIELIISYTLEYRGV